MTTGFQEVAIICIVINLKVIVSHSKERFNAKSVFIVESKESKNKSEMTYS